MTERDKNILQLVSRYGLCTASILGEIFFAGLSAKAVERVLTRLIGEGLLSSQPLIGRKHCYTLAPQGARLLGTDEKKVTKPLGTIALARNFGIMQYCLGQEPRKKKMTAREFAKRFPELAAKGMNHERYFLDEQSRLSLLVGDFGAEYPRLASKVRWEADRRRKLEAWKRSLRPSSLA